MPTRTPTVNARTSHALRYARSGAAAFALDQALGSDDFEGGGLTALVLRSAGFEIPNQ